MADERKRGATWRRERSRVEWEMMGFLQDQQGSGGSEWANIGSVRHDSNRKKKGEHMR